MNLQAQRTPRANWLAIGLVLLVTFLIGNFAVSAETNAVADFSTSTLAVDKSNAKIGQTVNYTLAVVNSGGDTTTDVMVTNTLPIDMSYVESANSLRPEDNGSVGVVTTAINISGRVLTWEGVISAGSTATFEFSAVVPNSAQLNDVLTNNAEIEHSSGDKSLSVSTTVVDAAPDISNSTFTVDKAEAKAGDRLEYTLMVLNDGDAGSVDVTIPLPNTVTYVTNSLMAPPAAGVISNPPSFSNGTVTWSFQISFNAKATLTFEVDIKENTALNTNIRTTAEIDAGTSVENITATTKVVEFTNSDVFMPIISMPFDAPVLSTSDIDQSGSNSTWTLSWTKPFSGGGSESYYIQEATDANFSNVTDTFTQSSRSLQITKPSSSTSTFYYRVKLLTGAGSPFSNVIEIDLNAGLSIDKAVINKDNDECTTLRWEFTGIKEFFINYAEGFDARAASGTGTATVCPSTDTTYTAIVVNNDDSIDRFSVEVDVIGSGCNRDPYVERFEPTATLVNNGDKITFFWDFECASEGAYFIGEGGPFGASSPGSREFTITGETLFKLRVTKKDSDGKIVFEDNASFTVRVR